MPDLTLKQIHYETEAWKKLAYYMMEENAQLKTWLGEILKGRSHNMLVEYVAKYQNEFIHIDELLSILRNHLANLDKLLECQNYITDNKDESLRRLEIIRNITKNTEQQFIKTRDEFFRSLLILLGQLEVQKKVG